MSAEPSLAARMFVPILAKLVSPMNPVEATKALVAMLPSLVDLPDGALCERCAVDIARGFDRVPSYGPLRRVIEVWWEHNKPKHGPALGQQSDDGLDAADRSMLIFWGEYVSGAKVLPEGVSLSAWLSMCRMHRPRAFAHLIKHDLKAAEIAVRKRWHVEQGDRAPPTEEEMAEVHERVEKALGEIIEITANLRTAQTQAPAPAAVQAFELKHGRKPGMLSAEQLEAQRAANDRIRESRAEVSQERRRRGPPDWATETPQTP